ncbi:MULTISPECIES: aldo/keto reductase [Arthrobacter]|uniref:Aldo/keto reductase n=1 Tax=Arthrobacter terricola TaxID=2547396 RepID=A0A4R5K8H6_9MICC|nr:MULTISPECIES: aldo/keto reductase [Arthrobacter]MBT8163464.1 aldo/keto reductase [Arthrobacter sp. GN70]TDF89762.1 aldo/keto reductase [Arthrobacter terricola]
MQYLRLGATGLKVSRLALGCMSFGEPGLGDHKWTLDESASRPIIRQALEAGINFFDTANSYSSGTSEEILGRALQDFGQREELVIATKVHGAFGTGPNMRGLSRKAIFTAADHSLRRLGTDYIDLYQIHRFDPDTPIEETLEALHDLVKSGKVRYLGASSMSAWQFSKLQYTAKANRWTPFVSMQDHYNLLNREEEREMHPLCADQGVGVIPWSPLARGRLTREWGTETPRSGVDQFGLELYEDGDKEIVDAVGSVAAARGIPRAQVALAWLLSRPSVTAPLIGANKAQHLDDAIQALSVALEDEEIKVLEAPYRPHRPAGF